MLSASAYCRRKNERLSNFLAETAATTLLHEVHEKDVKLILSGIAEGLDEQGRGNLKEILRSLIEPIVFDCSTLDCCMHYKIPVKSQDMVASPTRFELVLSP